MKNANMWGWLALALAALCTAPQAGEGAAPVKAAASAVQGPMVLRMPNVRGGPLTIRLRDWCHVLVRPSDADPEARRVNYDLLVFSGSAELTVPDVPGAAGRRAIEVSEGFAVSITFTWQPVAEVAGGPNYELVFAGVSEPRRHRLPTPEEPRTEQTMAPRFTVCGIYRKHEKPIVAGAPEEGARKSAVLRRGSKKPEDCEPGTALEEGDTLLSGLRFETYARFYGELLGQLGLVAVGPSSVLVVSERAPDGTPQALSLLQGSVRVRLVPVPAGGLLPLASFSAMSSLLPPPGGVGPEAPPVGPPPITPPPASGGQ